MVRRCTRLLVVSEAIVSGSRAYRRTSRALCCTPIGKYLAPNDMQGLEGPKRSRVQIHSRNPVFKVKNVGQLIGTPRTSLSNGLGVGGYGGMDDL